jgi:hypothetical protein
LPHKQSYQSGEHARDGQDQENREQPDVQSANRKQVTCTRAGEEVLGSWVDSGFGAKEQCAK